MILLDAVMPEPDGYETCRQIKASPGLSHVPIVFLTARTDHNAVEEALDAGAAACLSKPFDPMLLCDRIDSLIAGARKP